MKKLLKNQQGFTLVELMVVVAIIAILSTIAIPNFKKFQAKAKTSEAKLHLSSIYSTEVAFLSDADVYATCLVDMGYDASGQAAQRYYSTGFGSSMTSGGDTDGGYIPGGEINGVTCTTGILPDDRAASDIATGTPPPADRQAFFVAGKTTGGKPTIKSGELEDTYMSPTGSSFRAAAQGWISPSFIKANSSASIFNKALDSVVGQAYAEEEDVENKATLAKCEDTSNGGSSLFTINDDKTLKTSCNGY